MTKPRVPSKPQSRIGLFDFIWKWTSDETVKVSQEEVDYFRENPDEIDEFSSPVRLHKLFLFVAIAVGLTAVALSKALAFSGVLEGLPVAISEFIVDIVFEVGVALIGASIVTFMLSVVMNGQQKNALRWRAEIRKRIESDELES